MNRAVFLDRDNTLIHNDGDLGDPALVRLIKGAASAIASLRGLGYKIVVVTNQGGVARGRYGEEDVDRVHERLSELVKQMTGSLIDRYYYCPYHPKGTVEKYTCEHPWRKPQPGMLLQAAEDLQLDLEQCWLIGDALRDIEAGKAGGVRTVLVHPPAKRIPKEAIDAAAVKPDFVADTIAEAAKIIAQQRRPEPVEPEKTAFPWAIPAASQPGPKLNETEPKDAEPRAEQPGPPMKTSSTRRPFRPWTAAPEDADAGHEGGKVEQIIVERPKTRRPRPHAAPIPSQEAPKAQPKPQPEPEIEVEVEVEPPPAPARTKPKAAEPIAEVVDEASRESLPENNQALLRQILRELKLFHAQRDDFSINKLLGGLAQMLALGCLLFGLLAVGSPTAFFQWITGGIFLQLIVITLLMVQWQK